MVYAQEILYMPGFSEWTDVRQQFPDRYTVAYTFLAGNHSGARLGAARKIDILLRTDRRTRRKAYAQRDIVYGKIADTVDVPDFGVHELIEFFKVFEFTLKIFFFQYALLNDAAYGSGTIMTRLMRMKYLAGLWMSSDLLREG